MSFHWSCPKKSRATSGHWARFEWYPPCHGLPDIQHQGVDLETLSFVFFWPDGPMDGNFREGGGEGSFFGESLNYG